MKDSATVRKLREIKPDLIFKHRLTRLLAFDPAVIGEVGQNSIGILVAYREVPSLFEVSELQNDLKDQLGVKIYLAVKGMIQPQWEGIIENSTVDV
ncbi:MAG: hypothetical protein APF80_14270 [Alphaproteobacteria bacterium BRH_c36]|nr:MAG: hypothetical protein APF80_14270 [Alphaproteobacteria bacterium BRH_c36]